MRNSQPQPPFLSGIAGISGYLVSPQCPHDPDISLITKYDIKQPRRVRNVISRTLTLYI